MTDLAKIKWKNSFKILFLLGILFSTSCSKDVEDEDDIVIVVTTTDDADFTPTDWTTETHSKDADPNFDEVFVDMEVKRMDIVITED